MELSPVPGIRLGTASAGIKYPQRQDLVLMEIAPNSSCAAVFTRNAFCAAPVTIAKQHYSATKPRYLLINSGNANAGNGQAGLDDAKTSCLAVAELMGCNIQEVLPFSTGVIGEPLPLKRLVTGLSKAFADLRTDGWLDAAQGIMTTDTRPKVVSKQFVSDGQCVTVTGIAKGTYLLNITLDTEGREIVSQKINIL